MLTAARAQSASPHTQSAATVAFSWEHELQAGSAEQETWLVSFIDVLTLLLTLFVLLLAYQHRAAEQNNGAMAIVPASTVEQHTGISPVELMLDAVPNIPLQGGVTATVAVELTQQPEAIPETIQDAAVAAENPPADEAVDSAFDLKVDEAIPPLAEQQAPLIDSILRDDEIADAAFVSFPALMFGDALEREPMIEQIAQWAAITTVRSPTLPSNTVVADSADSIVDSDGTNDEPATIATELERLLARVDSSGLQDRIEATVIENGVSLEISDNILFAPAQAELTEAGRALLNDLAQTLHTLSFSLSVEGHTDNVPISTAQFPSNWELSSARATRVTRYLVEQGIAAQRVRAIGYADTQPRADNQSAEGRARNRRVSFILQAQ